MPERDTQTETWHAGPRITVGRVTLLPIERVVRSTGSEGGLLWCVQHKEPAAVVVRDGLGTHAVGPDGAPVALDLLRRRVPGLDAAIAAA